MPEPNSRLIDVLHHPFFFKITHENIRSPLGPVLANIFMCDFQEKWVMKNISQPTLWFRHVDDTFTLFKNKNDALSFLQLCRLRTMWRTTLSVTLGR